jgi:hypothetical protein
VIEIIDRERAAGNVIEPFVAGDVSYLATCDLPESG